MSGACSPATCRVYGRMFPFPNGMEPRSHALATETTPNRIANRAAQRKGGAARPNPTPSTRPSTGQQNAREVSWCALGGELVWVWKKNKCVYALESRVARWLLYLNAGGRDTTTNEAGWYRGMWDLASPVYTCIGCECCCERLTHCQALRLTSASHPGNQKSNWFQLCSRKTSHQCAQTTNPLHPWNILWMNGSRRDDHQAAILTPFT